MPKMKTKSGAKKRMQVKKSGKVKFGKAYGKHLFTHSKTPKEKRCSLSNTAAAHIAALESARTFSNPRRKRIWKSSTVSRPPRPMPNETATSAVHRSSQPSDPGSNIPVCKLSRDPHAHR